MIRFRRPTRREILDHLPASDLELSYSEVGATRELETSYPVALAGQYDLDRHEFRLGSGRPLYRRAVDSLLAWRHFEIPWLEFYGAGDPVHDGQVVATLVSLAGLWFLNPCRVVYTDVPRSSSDSAAFAYGTLPGHVERGEERFEVSFDPATEAVRYRISAFSRPALLLSRLGYPYARRLQRRFAEASARALAGAARGSLSGVRSPGSPA